LLSAVTASRSPLSIKKRQYIEPSAWAIITAAGGESPAFSLSSKPMAISLPEEIKLSQKMHLTDLSKVKIEVGSGGGLVEQGGAGVPSRGFASPGRSFMGGGGEGPGWWARSHGWRIGGDATMMNMDRGRRRERLAPGRGGERW
jgi:hypothetical protein